MKHLKQKILSLWDRQLHREIARIRLHSFNLFKDHLWLYNINTNESETLIQWRHSVCLWRNAVLFHLYGWFAKPYIQFFRRLSKLFCYGTLRRYSSLRKVNFLYILKIGQMISETAIDESKNSNGFSVRWSGDTIQF